jgi:hypothetical protein
MRKAWDPQQPVETLFKQIQDCVDYAEAGGVTISDAQKLQTAYANIFPTRSFHSACLCWNERNPPDQTWTKFKTQDSNCLPPAQANTGINSGGLRLCQHTCGTTC